MDIETQHSPVQENGAQVEESLSDPPGELKSGKEEVVKTLRPKQARSRSRTPQMPKEKKIDDNSKSKKEESKASNHKSDEQNKNGYNEKKTETKVNKTDEDKEMKSKKSENYKSPKTDNKDNKKLEGKESKSKKLDNAKSPRSENKKEEKKEISKKKVNTSSDVSSTESVALENNKSANGENTKEEKKENAKKQVNTSSDISNTGSVKLENSKSPNPNAENKEASKQNEDVEKADIAEPKAIETEKDIKITISKPESEGVEMDPLVLAVDEPDPELLFDENSDMESGKGSPIQTRCKTRRSHSRNIPTPKTPKSTDSESEKNSAATPTPESLNDTNDSANVGNISTRAEAGGDETRLEYMAHNYSTVSEDNSFLNYSRERSLRETLRCLSPRKTIRPLNDSYRLKAFKNIRTKSDLNVPYSEEESVNRITGVKRKRSHTPEERKKFKPDSSGFVSYLSSPLSSIKNRFIHDTSTNSSTPKLTGYKDSRQDIHEDFSYTEVVSENEDKKNWCSIM